MTEPAPIRLPAVSAWELPEYYRRLKAAIIALEAAWEEGDLVSALDDPEHGAVLGGEILASYRRLLKRRDPRATAFRRNSIHALLEPVKELLLEPRRDFPASDATPPAAAAAIDIDTGEPESSAPPGAADPEIDPDVEWWELPSLAPGRVKLIRAEGPEGETLLRIDQAIAARAWGIGLEFEDPLVADAVATLLVHLAIHRVAMDLRGLEDIERWLERRPAAEAAGDSIHIVPDILGRRFEQLMLDILNEHEAIARRAPLVEDFVEKTDLRVHVPDLNRRRGARIQVTQTTYPERLEQKLARIRNVNEFIILSPRSLADALDHEEGMELLTPSDLDEFWSSFQRPPMTVEEMAAGIKRIFRKAMDRADEDPRGPIAFVPGTFRRLVVAYVTAEAYRSTSELRRRENRVGRRRRRR